MQLAFAASILLATSAMSDTASSELEKLKSTSLGSTSPSTIVLIDRERSGLTSFSAYEIRNGDDRQGYWLVRKVETIEGRSVVHLADSRSCPRLMDNLVELERLSLPRLEIFSRPPSQLTSPPSLGALHVRGFAWIRGWTPHNEPLEVTLTSLGSGPVIEWAQQAADDLSDCWAVAPNAAGADRGYQK